MNDSAKRHRPLRTCVVCRRKRYKFHMMRLCINNEGRVVTDPAQQMPGRGAYACPDRGCLALAKANHKKCLNRAFKRGTILV